MIYLSLVNVFVALYINQVITIRHSRDIFHIRHTWYIPACTKLCCEIFSRVNLTINSSGVFVWKEIFMCMSVRPSFMTLVCLSVCLTPRCSHRKARRVARFYPPVAIPNERLTPKRKSIASYEYLVASLVTPTDFFSQLLSFSARRTSRMPPFRFFLCLDFLRSFVTCYLFIYFFHHFHFPAY